MPLTPDKIEKINGVTVKTYLLTQHNPNKISMPTYALPSTPIGVTIHNTESISVASNTTPAEQYTRATVNGNLGTVRVHFYVDDTCAWQNLPLTLSGWHAADGNGKGNRQTIAFEVIGNSKKAEENAAKLAAYYLKKYGKTVDNGLFTHTHWLNVRDGVTGNIDYLNTRKHPYKWCPAYILPHWNTFKEQVKTEFSKLGGTAPTDNKPADNKPAEEKKDNTTIYRIRKSWDDAKSQIGAYSNLDNAIKSWKEGYNIYDSNGKKVYPTTPPVAPAEKIDVTYKVYASKKWWPEVRNLEDYAGVNGKPITSVAVKVAQGQIAYRVHQKGSKWMNWITGYNTNDLIKGFAGVPGIAIDAIQMKYTGKDGYTVKYRVAAVGNTNYYAWVEGDSDYAGVFGKTFDKLQIEIVKK